MGGTGLRGRPSSPSPLRVWPHRGRLLGEQINGSRHFLEELGALGEGWFPDRSFSVALESWRTPEKTVVTEGAIFSSEGKTRLTSFKTLNNKN